MRSIIYSLVKYEDSLLLMAMANFEKGIMHTLSRVLPHKQVCRSG
jgi:hypothetical protein